MAQDSKHKNAGLWSRFRRLCSSSSSGRDGRDDLDEPIAQDIPVPVPQTSLHGRRDTPSSVEESHVPVVKAESIPSPIETSTSIAMFSKAHHFNVGGNIIIESSQYVYHVRNSQDKSVDGTTTFNSGQYPSQSLTDRPSNKVGRYF